MALKICLIHPGCIKIHLTIVKGPVRVELCANTINTEDQPVSAMMLWEKITAIMTDAASKCLKIQGVAESLSSTHIPFHLLCKAHPVEAFDRSNLEVLRSVEREVGFRQKLEMINYSVKSFLCGKTSC